MFKFLKREISSEEKIRVTNLIYNKAWDEGASIVLQEISKKKAKRYALGLVSEKGWRERVTGAVIVHVYKLQDLVPHYIESFRESPETHTCHAFMKMISFLPDGDRQAFQEQLASMCSNDNHGLHLLAIINGKTNE